MKLGVSFWESACPCGRRHVFARGCFCGRAHVILVWDKSLCGGHDIVDVARPFLRRHVLQGGGLLVTGEVCHCRSCALVGRVCP